MHAVPALLMDVAVSASSSPAALPRGEQALLQQTGTLLREFLHELRNNSLMLTGGILLAVSLYALLLLVRKVVRRRFRHKTVFGTWRWVLLRVLSRTTAFFLAVLSARICMALFETPATWQSLLSLLFTVAAAVQGAFWLREFLISLVERRAGRDREDSGISSAVGVLTVLINIVVWTLAAVILLDNVGVNVTALVAGLGIGGIAIGLAAQGIFSDLFAALSILFDQPFRRGDQIQIGGVSGVSGTVERIGLKTTRLRARSGEMVVMSNANLLDQQINNLSSFTSRRMVLPVRVGYRTEADLLARIPAELKQLAEGIPDCRFVSASLVQFALSTLDYELICNVASPDYEALLDSRQALMLAIIRRFAELGIEFALPAQIHYLAGADGKIVDPFPDR